MAMNPLLVFTPPKPVTKRDSLPPNGSSVRFPDLDDQSGRVFPKVELLERKFAEYIELSDTADGFLPEKVLVLEVAGEIHNLASALARVPGFEYLSSALLEKDFESADFYTLSNGSHKPVSKNAYLTMSNQAGLSHLLALWRRYQQTNEVERGYGPLKNVFNQLTDIRFWDTRDRLEATFVLDDWRYRLEDAAAGYDDPVPFEIELWYRASPEAQSQAESRIRGAVTRAGGRISGGCLHGGISYHALIGQLPVSKIQEILVKGGEILELMRCDEVMFFRPLGQCGIPVIEENTDVIDEEPNLDYQDLPDPYANPVVAILDGLPLENHQALSGRLDIDDPDDFESFYTSPSYQSHGTSMASLVVHGDLSEPTEPPLSRRVHVRPVMIPGSAGFDGFVREQIPAYYLPADLIHRAVVRMKKGENGQPPTAPEVSIINLSVGDPYRMYDAQMSPWARMLDWLSVEFQVLFVVSAGNSSLPLVLDNVAGDDFANLTPVELEEHALKAIASQRPFRRLLSPAESINALTVGASHSDGFIGNLPAQQVDIFSTRGMFSPINPIALGRRKSVKPEIHMPGGRQTYVNKTITANDPVRLNVTQTSRFGPGLKSAMPGVEGTLNQYGYTAGTSNAAALATRRLAILNDTLQEMKAFGYQDSLSKAPDALILKTMLVHGAEHNGASSALISRYLDTKSRKTFKSDLNQYLGFGSVDESRIHFCADNQATLIYSNVIEAESAQDYFLPLPPSLAAKTVNRRLIVTVAWFSPVNHGHKDYRGAQLWASPAYGTIDLDEIDYYSSHLKNGTVFHDIRRGSRASAFTQGDKLAIRINCYGRAGIKKLKVPYVVIATLDTPGVALPVYQEVRDALRVAMQQNA
ncbi:S8 family peptidase [Citrobacter sp. Cb220]|uniref:S8 family peptidase n=1 Tax=Citrobacter sp. Cb220 TaxID=2985034 RepID=UPI00257909BB|nr:S8 family peptidase [Citrobacter sp. Cb220]MDM3315974.1 S8 family peptidase [Citrobacter sp. Cb220]